MLQKKNCGTIVIFYKKITDNIRLKKKYVILHNIGLYSGDK